MATVLTAGIKTDKVASPYEWCLDLVAATSEVLFKGGMVEIVTATGLVRAAGTSAVGAARVVGRAESDTKTAANISGANVAGGKVKVGSGVFTWANSGTNAVTQIHVGSKVYVENDKTISSLNTLPVAGICVGFTANTVDVLQVLAPLNV